MSKTTKQIVQEMLAQPVRSMLDSGDFYGRAYEKYVGVDWDKIAPATFTEEDGFTRSLYHHFLETLMVDEEREEDFHAFIKHECSSLDSNEEIIMNWAKARSYKILRRESTLEPEYNPLNGHFQWFTVRDDNVINNEYFLVIATHNGCDIRAGWSYPHVFQATTMPEARTCSGSLVCLDFNHEWKTFSGKDFYTAQPYRTPMFDENVISWFYMDDYYNAMTDTYTLPVCPICRSNLIVKG
jgi:hypothetical protein